MYSFHNSVLTGIRRAERTCTERRAWVALLHVAIFSFSALASFLLRFEFRIPAAELYRVNIALGIWVAVKLVVFHLAGLDRGWWRFVSVHDMRRLALANFYSSTLSFTAISLLSAGFPRSIYILDFIICSLFTAGIRVAVRITMEAGLKMHSAPASSRLLIYGAGRAGQALLREMRVNLQLPYEVRGFIDDDVHMHGLLIRGMRVLGGGDDLARLVREHHIQEILIAIPSANSLQMTAILRRCQAAGVSYKTIPGLGDLVEGNALASQIRQVAVEDVLARNPVRLEEGLIRGALDRKIVMVTGAAGSIGSELCRQIARFRPAGIVGFDIAESPLFELDREMRQRFPDVPFWAEIGSVQNLARVREVLERHSPSVLYHAAAYKHVPMMEEHVFEAIENNVFGTYNVAIAAADYGVEDFVLISSDKAVRPTNVMGATKRIAELILLSLQNGRTKFVAVRFGNVLGSNGSVIPIFKKQIAAGGPVTVTHPEMRRFFMTIPEACQLVLQASVLASGGQICVLDMGEPVKIVDLARNLILLTGLRPDEDIKIEFTGIRPGEKLYEELTMASEDTAPTTHEKVRIYIGNAMPEGDMITSLECLRSICQTRDSGRLVVALKEIVIDYSPSADLLKRVIATRENPALALAS